jgi:site-specific DNA recombinase
VRLVTLSEGEIGELHVGLKGTMNALFLKDLAHKTRRGLEGRVRQGKSGGGLCFGYEVVRKVDASGEALHGERRINQGEAAIVRRIFEEFAKGRSPRAIAQSLNKAGIAGPGGRSWGPSTIYGNWRRGTGLLNNELYIGRLVWNRQLFIKDPATGRRQARLNPEAKWIVEEVPQLRIVDDHLWKAVKERQRGSRLRVMTEDLIEEIRLVPENGKLRVELYGELAALLNLANEHPRSKGTGVQITLVAGAGFVQERTRWELRRLV